MKKSILTLCGLFPILLFGQTTINNAENFEIGTVIVYQSCVPDSVEVGEDGENQIWDFSTIQIKESEKITEHIIAPETTTYWKQFPESNIVKIHSNGLLDYVQVTENRNYLLGSIDTISGMTIIHENSMLLAKRPIKYGDEFKDEYITRYSVNGMGFNGSGTITIKADGYGKLILPNGTHNNVLRVKITQNKSDTLRFEQDSLVTKTEAITYVWFDKEHTSALFKISGIKSEWGTLGYKTVEFLLREETEQ